MDRPAAVKENLGLLPLGFFLYSFPFQVSLARFGSKVYLIGCLLIISAISLATFHVATRVVGDWHRVLLYSFMLELFWKNVYKKKDKIKKKKKERRRKMI